MKKRLFFAMLPILGVVLASCGEKAPTTTSVVTSTQEAVTTSKKSTTTSVDDKKMNFTCKVLYPDGTPAEGLKIQWCDTNGLCNTNTPATDANGNAVNSLDKDKTYNVHIMKTPSGYGYNPYECVQSKDSNEGIIHLFALNELSGEGTSTNPYQITKGSYKITLEAGTKYYFDLTVTANTEYTIEAYASFNTKIANYGQDNKFVAQDVGKNTGYGENFKYTFTTGDADESKPWKLMMIAAEEESFYFTVK